MVSSGRNAGRRPILDLEWRVTESRAPDPRGQASAQQRALAADKSRLVALVDQLGGDVQALGLKNMPEDAGTADDATDQVRIDHARWRHRVPNGVSWDCLPPGFL